MIYKGEEEMLKILIPRKYSKPLNEKEIAKIFNLRIEEVKEIIEECNKPIKRIAVAGEEVSLALKNILSKIPAIKPNIDIEELEKLSIDNSVKKKKGKIKKNWERNKFYERH